MICARANSQLKIIFIDWGVEDRYPKANMLIASNNILQEEWVQLWLDRLTPKQQVLVIEVLKDGNKRRKPTAAAVVQAEDAIGFAQKRLLYVRNDALKLV